MENLQDWYSKLGTTEEERQERLSELQQLDILTEQRWAKDRERAATPATVLSELPREERVKRDRKMVEVFRAMSLNNKARAIVRDTPMDKVVRHHILAGLIEERAGLKRELDVHALIKLYDRWVLMTPPGSTVDDAFDMLKVKIDETLEAPRRELFERCYESIRFYDQHDGDVHSAFQSFLNHIDTVRRGVSA